MIKPTEHRRRKRQFELRHHKAKKLVESVFGKDSQKTVYTVNENGLTKENKNDNRNTVR